MSCAPSHLSTSWDRILPGLVEALPLLGIAERDILLTGQPLTVTLGSWGSITPSLHRDGAVVVVRASSPSQAAIVVHLESNVGAVLSDILDAVESLHLRRKRRLDAERATEEDELREMTTSTGWISTGVGNRCAGFRDQADLVRGRVTRSEYRRGDPATDRFEIAVTISAVNYASALEILAKMRRDVVAAQPRQQTEGPANSALVLVG